MVEFIAMFSALVAFVVMPTTDPGIKIKDTQDNSITLTAFENNFDRADLFARGFCNKKGKQHKLNIEKSRNYYFPTSLNIYNFDCITQNPEEAVMIVPSSDEVSAVTPVEAEPESEKVTSPECSSNIFIGQEEADGSWKTVCKE